MSDSHSFQVKVQLTAEEYVAFKAVAEEIGTTQSGLMRMLAKERIRSHAASMRNGIDNATTKRGRNRPMDATIDLFSSDPLIDARRRSAVFRDGFIEWLEINIHVYLEFERRAMQVARFRNHYSGYTILEVMRHDSAIGELNGEWKLNNNQCADLCRLFALCNPNHSGLFEFRSRKAA